MELHPSCFKYAVIIDNNISLIELLKTDSKPRLGHKEIKEYPFNIVRLCFYH